VTEGPHTAKKGVCVLWGLVLTTSGPGVIMIMVSVVARGASRGRPMLPSISEVTERLSVIYVANVGRFGVRYVSTIYLQI